MYTGYIFSVDLRTYIAAAARGELNMIILIHGDPRKCLCNMFIIIYRLKIRYTIAPPPPPSQSNNAQYYEFEKCTRCVVRFTRSEQRE